MPGRNPDITRYDVKMGTLVVPLSLVPAGDDDFSFREEIEGIPPLGVEITEEGVFHAAKGERMPSGRQHRY